MKKEKLIQLMVRIRPDQKEWLKVHQMVTGNCPAEIIRLLLDFYMALDAEESK